ncbi:PREDICTED: occludin/ELL domain-containing protein 1-like, partial [Acanthisitta chloris]|uniref:occludin/ELL domain-containing protein 1-like n=1 Tax=Acanthisitta chloris TaxID=57068 RepID=UPI0004F0C4E3
VTLGAVSRPFLSSISALTLLILTDDLQPPVPPSLEVPEVPAVPRRGDSPRWSPQCLFTSLPCVLKPLPACARRVTFEDEVMPARGPSGRVCPAKAREKTGDRSVLPTLSHSIPDYVVRYPTIRSLQQREGYKGVFQDQLAEYMDLLQELRAKCHPPSRTDSAWLEKQQRCEYLKKKLTHLKAQIQEYDRVTLPSAGGS